MALVANLAAAVAELRKGQQHTAQAAAAPRQPSICTPR
jgi:hypothetical protein